MDLVVQPTTREDPRLMSAALTRYTHCVRYKLHHERSPRSCQPAYPGKVAAPCEGRCGRSGNQTGKLVARGDSEYGGRHMSQTQHGPKVLYMTSAEADAFLNKPRYERWLIKNRVSIRSYFEGEFELTVFWPCQWQWTLRRFWQTLPGSAAIKYNWLFRTKKDGQWREFRFTRFHPTGRPKLEAPDYIIRITDNDPPQRRHH